MGTEDHKDITDVLTAVHLLDCVQPPIPEGPNEEAATPAGPSTTEGPSTSSAPAGCPSRPLVATPRVVPTPNPFPSTPHPFPNIPDVIYKLKFIYLYNYIIKYLYIYIKIFIEIYLYKYLDI